MNSYLYSVPLYVPVLLPVVAAAVGYFVQTKVYKHLLIAVQVVQVFLAAILLARVRTAGAILERLGGWQAPVGIELALDEISAPLVLLVTVVFLLLVLFNYRKLYMVNTFQFLLVSLQGVMISLFLTSDVFNVYVLTELTTIIVTVLILFKRGKPALYNGMLYLMFSILAMAFFLLGIGFVYRTFGVLDFAGITERAAAIENPRALILPYALMVTAVGMKAGLLPMFGWLPRAHAAPSAPSMVSALLSGLQVKVGIYLFIRLQQMIGLTLDTTGFFLVVGLLTAVSGFLLAICQRDIKLVLAYSTVSQIGLIMIGLTSGSVIGFWGGMLHIVNHALFKALLFLTAGLIAKEYGTRNLDQIRGTFRRMPLVTTAAFLAVLGMTGAPFFNGSISKYLIESGLAAGTRWQAAIYLVNFGTMLVFTRYATVFFGRPAARSGGSSVTDRSTRPVDPWTRVVALVFGAAILGIGLFAGPVMSALFPVESPLELVSGATAAGKAVAFAGTLAAAVTVYLFGVSRLSVLERVREMSVSFNGMAILMSGFLGVVLVFLFATV